MGKTVVAQAAAERLQALATPVEIVELPEDQPGCAAALEAVADRSCLVVGDLSLHRALDALNPQSRLRRSTLQRFPQVPLVRRDVRSWLRAIGLALAPDEFEQLFVSTGGHPSLTAAWIQAFQRSGIARAATDLVRGKFESLFARVDAALAHPELAGLYAWLEREGPASVRALRKATGAEKGRIDRLVITGPVSRTLGERAEIAITCGLYERHRAGRRTGPPSVRADEPG